MLLLLTFTASIFTSALLLFIVQPMVAKFILPSLGGSPAVWNTCMLFFQAALLLGYLYAHLLTKLVKSTRTQVIIHGVVLVLAAVALPVRMRDWTPPADEMPVGWLLGLLGVMIGGPFFALSTNGPLMQRWFSTTGHPSSHDPYFLYAASNLGSMISLIGYPFLIESTLTRSAQGFYWTIGYGLFVVLALASGTMMLKRGATATNAASSEPENPVRSIQPLTWGRRLSWTLLAFVPSSLMLGVTQYLTTDVASMPLLWIIPLVIYLLTFIIAFSPRLWWVGSGCRWLMPAGALMVLGVMYLGKFDDRWTRHLGITDQTIVYVFAVQLAFFFVASMACHGRLAAQRPHPSRLTEFYLILALGGVLGGIFNALIAPIAFRSVLEYPIAIVLGCLVAMPGRPWPDLARPMSAGVSGLRVVLCAGLSVGFSLMIRDANTAGGQANLLAIERTFFGVHRVFADPAGTVHSLTHGAVTHGMQIKVPITLPDGRTIDGHAYPTKYFSPQGPMGNIFESFASRTTPFRAAVVGLGVGTLAAYAKEGQEFDFYEIDPAVRTIASDPSLFTFLEIAEKSKGARIKIVMGDARLTIRGAGDASYDLIILDAFSSDSIPIHLVTKEAVAMYLAKLAPEGMLVFNATNRYMNIRPVLTAIAGELGLVSYERDKFPTEQELRLGSDHSTWMVLARTPEHAGIIPRTLGWNRTTRRPDDPLWTDDAANILDVVKWKNDVK
jgi:hypothetical protein